MLCVIKKMGFEYEEAVFPFLRWAVFHAELSVADEQYF